MNARADLHFHTWHSIDSLISPRSAVQLAVKKQIKVLGITDHDTIEGAKRAQNYVKTKHIPVEIVIGEEIYTNGGHVIGLYLKKRVPSFRSLGATLENIKSQGGLAIIPHMSFERDFMGTYLYRFKVSYQDLAEHQELLDMVDGIEVENFVSVEKDFYEKAHFVNETFLHKAEISSSDCHVKVNFGHTYTMFEGETAHDLRKAILQRRTIPVATKSYRTIQQAISFGPCVKLPIHLGLLTTYRLTAKMAQIGQLTFKKLFRAK